MCMTFHIIDAWSIITWIILGVMVLVPCEISYKWRVFLALNVSFCMARGVREDNKQQRKIMILCKTDLKHDNEERKGEI